MGKGGASGGLRAQKGVGAEEWGKEGQFLQVPLPSSAAVKPLSLGQAQGRGKLRQDRPRCLSYKSEYRHRAGPILLETLNKRFL